MSFSKVKVIKVREFSRYPFGRYRAVSKFSGEEFREDWLVPAIQETENPEGPEKIIVDFEGTRGVAPSFLDEAFGGLVRNEGISPEEVERLVEVVSDLQPDMVEEVRGYVRESGASRGSGGSSIWRRRRQFA